MNEHDLLTRLPDAGYPTTTRSMPRIVGRAHEIRRGRRLFASGAVAGVASVVAAVTVTLGGVPFPGGNDAVTTLDAASQTGEDCRTGFAAVKKVSDLPNLVYLASEASTGPMTGPLLARHETDACAYQPPQAIAYTLKDGAVDRRLQIGSAQARNQYAGAGTGGFEFGGTITHATVDGVTADIYGDPEQPWLYMFWTAPDGSSRELQADGLTRSELAHVAGELEFGDDGSLEQGTPPGGLDEWAQLPPWKPASAAKAKEYSYVEQQLHGGGDSPGWTFEVRDRPWFSNAPIGGQRVTIDLSTGPVTGWWQPDGGGGSDKGQGSLIWQTAGLEFALSGNSVALGLDQALAVASSVTKASPADPRIVEAGEN